MKGAKIDPKLHSLYMSVSNTFTAVQFTPPEKIQGGADHEILINRNIVSKGSIVQPNEVAEAERRNTVRSSLFQLADEAPVPLKLQEPLDLKGRYFKLQESSYERGRNSDITTLTAKEGPGREFKRRRVVHSPADTT